jgi:DNA-binding PadR family transcriptional regulator
LDVKDLCLGALTYGDATGYDIKKFFESSFSHCFLAGYGSIYPALAELTDEKLVTARTLPGRGRPSRKLYRLTDAGRRAFLAKLQETEPQHKVKSEFLVLMYFAHLLPKARLDAILDERLAEIERQLVVIAEFEGDGERDVQAYSSGARFVSGFGKTLMGAARDYIRTHRHGLSKGAGAASSTKHARTRRKAVAAASRN